MSSESDRQTPASPQDSDRLDALLARGLPQVPPAGRALIGLLLAIAVVQAIFWGVFYSPWMPGASTAKIERIAFTSTTVARIKAPTVEGAAQVEHEAVALPWTHCCDPTYLSLRLGFDLRRDGDEPGARKLFEALSTALPGTPEASKASAQLAS